METVKDIMDHMVLYNYDSGISQARFCRISVYIPLWASIWAWFDYIIPGHNLVCFYELVPLLDKLFMETAGSSSCDNSILDKAIAAMESMQISFKQTLEAGKRLVILYN